MVPDGWKKELFGNVTTFKNGLNFTLSEKGERIKIVGVRDFKDFSELSSMEKLETVQVSSTLRDDELLNSEDLLFVRSNGNKDLIGRCLYFPNIEERISYSGFTIRGRVNKAKILPQYASFLVRADFIKKQFSESGGGTNISNLNQQILNSVTFGLPPLSEQKKIAKILSTWDQAISIAEQLLENSQRQKKSLEEDLLLGKKRIPGFDLWQKKNIGDFIVENRAPGSYGDTAKKLTIRLYGQGVVAKNEKRSGSENTKYYKRFSGQFIYSKLDFLNGAFGIVPNNLDGYESTLDLPAFDFKGDISPIWFLKFISRERFYSANIGLANGGRKARRVNPIDLLRIEIEAPQYEEQKAIANVLLNTESEVLSLQAKISCLKQEKKALMQQLLTGKRRVKVDAVEACANEHH